MAEPTRQKTSWADARLDNIGHAGSQVKPRGQRIEPRDIDNEL